MEPDFSGWATKTNLKCADGRTILHGAFDHMDQKRVPLVWQHGHADANNVLGHVLLEAHDDGVRAHAYFNATKQGLNAKDLVVHKDITNLSIYANQLVEKGKNVIHGFIREVSLVLAGANPGALIDSINLQHDDGSSTVLEDEAIIFTGLELEHAGQTSVKTPPAKAAPAPADDSGDEEDEKTVQDVYDSMTEEQKNVVNYMIGVALESVTNSGSAASNAKHSDENPGGDHLEGANSMGNVFAQEADRRAKGLAPRERHVLSHEDVKGIVADAMKSGGSLKDAVEAYAVKHGITSIETLFPDALNVNGTPDFMQRRVEWVPGVLNSVHRTPFSRVKSIVADITQDAARARGYIKGTYKEQEWLGVTKRTTTPTTVYKKQQLDRDDVVDITDFDVVAWIRAEMRMMLEEELARAILIGDGRNVSDTDKIKDPMAAADGSGIRSIANEHELYATTIEILPGADGTGYLNVVEGILRARTFYKGTGQPTFYTTNKTIVEMLLTKDQMGRRYWNSTQELCAALMVSAIVEVEVMEGEADLYGIIVNLSDYNVGADKGGEVNLFDDFDINYNQYQYLIETRISGALVKIKSALVIKAAAAGSNLVAPAVPTFNAVTGIVTIPTVTGVVYKNSDTNATLSAGAQTALAIGATLNVVAVPASTYVFANDYVTDWSFVCVGADTPHF